MKRLMVLALLGSLSLAAPAQTEADNAVRIHGYQIDLPTKAYPMYKGDFDTYKGVYNLSNDDTLVMSQVGRRMYAEMGDGQRRELVAAGPNVFVALDRQLKITLVPTFFGDFTGEVLRVVPGTATAANPGQVIRLVSIR